MLSGKKNRKNDLKTCTFINFYELATKNSIFQKILSWFGKNINVYVSEDSESIWFFWRNVRLWLILEAAPYIQSVYPFSCTISTYRSTTLPKDFVIALLVWLQWWSKVAISSEKRENFEIFVCPRWIFFSKKTFKNILKVVFYTF